MAALGNLVSDLIRVQDAIAKTISRLEEARDPLRDQAEVDKLNAEAQVIQQKIDLASTVVVSCSADFTVEASAVARTELAISGDPVIALPKQKPSGSGETSCKTYAIRGCQVDEGKEKSYYQAVHEDGKVTVITWSSVVKNNKPFINIKPTASTSVTFDEKDGTFTSTLNQDAGLHSVEICLNLDHYDLLASLVPKGPNECYALVDIDMEGKFLRPGATDPISIKMELQVAWAFPRQASLVVRQVKEEGGGRGSSADVLTVEFVAALKTKVNAVYKQVELEFSVTKADDLVLAASNFLDGVLKLDPKTGFNADLVAAAAADPATIDAFAIGTLPKQEAGQTPREAKGKQAPYTTVEDAQQPITYCHELGHYLGWELVPGDLNSVILKQYGKVNVCRPKAATKSDLLMFDNAASRTDEGLLTDGNLKEMHRTLCANSKVK